MDFIFLTQVGGILKPFAWVMGEILSAIYKLCSFVGLANIALCIVIFTIVVKMLMLPLTIKQQKFSKVSAKMNPELQALQKKYANADRKNQAVMEKMQQEQQDIYRKYGSSPFGGCLPLLITLPILFALYRVIYAVPAYVDDVNAMYKSVSDAIINEYDEAEDFDYMDALEEFCKKHSITPRTKASKAKNDTDRVIDILSVFNTAAWEDFQEGKPILDKDDNPDEDCENWNAMVSTPEFAQIMAKESKNMDKILGINSLFGKFNILDSPGLKFPAILLPILAALLQFLQGQISMSVNKSSDSKKSEDPMGNSMKTMNTVMPIMSGVICVMLPIGVGIYWVANSVVTIVQQLAINHHLNKIDIDDMIEENAKKQREKYEKMGVVASDNTTSNIAKSSTKAISNMKTAEIKSKAPVISQEAREEIANAEKGSISSIANILKERNKEK